MAGLIFFIMENQKIPELGDGFTNGPWFTEFQPRIGLKFKEVDGVFGVQVFDASRFFDGFETVNGPVAPDTLKELIISINTANADPKVLGQATITNSGEAAGVFIPIPESRPDIVLHSKFFTNNHAASIGSHDVRSADYGDGTVEVTLTKDHERQLQWYHTVWVPIETIL